MDKVTLKKKINDLFIVRENDGSYNLFGKYTVIPDNNSYKVNVNGETEFLHFSSLRNAVTWCVFEKNNKYKEIKRIHELDELISSLNVIIAQHTKLLEKTTSEDKYIYSAKLAEGKVKKKQAIKEIEEYANISRYWQRKKFSENQDKNI